MPPRARALPPTERRAALVDSALTLIRQHGTVPSTKEIAEAAGVAEGTIFRAFDTKDDLIHEVVALTFCPAPLIRQLHGVDATLPLRERLVAAVDILQRRYSEVFDLMVGLRLSAPPMGDVHDHPACSAESGHVPNDDSSARRPCVDPMHRSKANRGKAAEALVALIEPDAELLTCSSRDLARYLRLLTFAGSHDHLTDGNPLTPETIVDLLLEGVLDPQLNVRQRADGMPDASRGGAGIRAVRPNTTTPTRKAR